MGIPLQTIGPFTMIPAHEARTVSTLIERETNSKAHKILMTKRCDLVLWDKKLIFLLGGLLLFPLAGYAGDSESSQTVVEVALLRPVGELGAAYDETFVGLGADTGYEVGFRLRLPLTPNFSISPGFHFVDFESHLLIDEAEEEFKTEALSYRFTMEGMLRPRCGNETVRPFLAVAAGLYRNRIVGFYDDPFAAERNDSINSFGYSVRWGFTTNHYEVSFVVHRNRVDTWKFFPKDAKQSYRWDNFAVRLGYPLPW